MSAPPTEASFFIATELIDERLGHEVSEGRQTFTAVVSARKVKTKARIALLSSDGSAIDAVAILTPGGVIATRQRRVRIEKCTPIPSVEIDSLLRRLPGRNRSAASAIFSDTLGGELTQAAWREVRNVLLEDEGDCLHVILRLEDILTEEEIRSAPAAILRSEQDAVGVALRIAGVDHNMLAQYRHQNTGEHFLFNLEDVAFREDQLIQHDSAQFLDWEQMGFPIPGAFRFKDSGREVVIMNVNRTAVEETVGVDLIYHNEYYDSFVLVQYKRFRRERQKYRFRPSSDSSLKAEIKRMKSVAKVPRGPVDLKGYRLNDNPCYFKLCQPDSFKPGDQSLIRGMYIPLPYWSLLCDDKSTKGPKGGTVLSYDTVDRYLNNTRFIEFVKDGWIGSTGKSSETIKNLIKKALEGKRAVIFAVEPDNGDA